MFKTRLLSGIILIILAIVTIGYGGLLLIFTLCAISLIGMYELYRVFSIQWSPLGVLGYLSCIALYLYYAIQYEIWPVNLLPFMVILTILCLACFVFLYPKYRVSSVAIVLFSFVYIAVMLSFIYLLRSIQITGPYIVWLVFLCSWGCDTCAYCAGRLFGKHKMAPVLSPKKSIEGAVGGVIGTLILTGIFIAVFRDTLAKSSVEVVFILIASGLGALVSMVGDLAASAIKRNYDIKDYGTLIPGHGGILDRFDSVIIVSPIVYYVYIAFLTLSVYLR